MKIEQMIEQHEKMWAAFEKLNEKLEEKQAPYEPKDGEYCYVKTKIKSEFIFIKNSGTALTSKYISLYLNENNKHFALGDCYACTDNASITELRPATPEEKQLLDDKLKEQGKRWNAEKKQIEDIPTWKVGDWFIPHKPEDVLKLPDWVDDMDNFDGKRLKVESITIVGWLWSNDFNFHPDWCEKTESPKEEPKIGDMCIFWDIDKEYAICALYSGVRHDYFLDTTGAMWQNCIPFESIEQYKKFINEEC